MHTFPKPYNQTTIYYAHNKEKYKTFIEVYEKEIIQENFLKSMIINPADYESEWKNAGFDEDQIINKCFSFIQLSDIVVFSSIPKNEDHFVIGLGTFLEVLFARKLFKKIYFLYMISVSEGILLLNFELRPERGGSWHDYYEVIFSFDYTTYTNYLDFQVSSSPSSIIISPPGINQTYEILKGERE